ncbi:MAG: acetate--CoA ligase [Patescibacteria group bacterium]
MSNLINFKKKYQQDYRSSLKHPEEFWSKQAKLLTWFKSWKKVLTGNFVRGTSRWFTGAELNITVNCLDRHLPARGGDLALIWEPNLPGAKGLKYTYQELYEKVCRMANVLKKYGVKKGDIVCIYLPMIPEAMIAMLACARLGAVHNVVFAGFSARSLADRINDCGAFLLIASDYGYRGSKVLSIKNIVDEALLSCPQVTTVLLVKKTAKKIPLKTGRDFWLKPAMIKAGKECPATIVRSEDPLFVLYTSGSTGKPKGVVHASGGYMVYADYSFRSVFGYQPGEIYWATADVGWITGHTYVVYGPLLAGATIVMFEGLPTYPSPSRYWAIIDKYQVNIFYTAPTVIRSLESFGPKYVKPYRLKSLRLLGSVGEPLNAEAWHWYQRYVGKGRCPIVDTWWQTETGGILLSPLPVSMQSKPGSVGKPLPGIFPVILDVTGQEITTPNQIGYLCLKKPWPALAITLLNDKKRFLKTYFSTFPGHYFTGDAAKKDQAGCYFIQGRVDDVINVSGYRIGCAEVESAITLHPAVAEASVVAYRHPIKGEGIYAFVVTLREVLQNPNLKEEIREIVRKEIGHIARPDKIQIVRDLPKTRSGKIIRRILRRLAIGETLAGEDLTTLTNPEIIAEIKESLDL